MFEVAHFSSGLEEYRRITITEVAYCYLTSSDHARHIFRAAVTSMTHQRISNPWAELRVTSLRDVCSAEIAREHLLVSVRRSQMSVLMGWGTLMFQKGQYIASQHIPSKFLDTNMMIYHGWAVILLYSHKRIS